MADSLREQYARPFSLAMAVFLVILALIAARWGLADLYAWQAGEWMEAWAERDKPPDDDEWQSARRALEVAVLLDGKRAGHHRAMGHLYVWAEFAAPVGDPDAMPLRQKAVDAFRRAVELRPVWAVAWTDLALVKARMGQLDDEFSTAVAEAARMGPWEPGVQISIAQVGLTHWASLKPSTRQVVTETVMRGVSGQPGNMAIMARKAGKHKLFCNLLVSRRKTAPTCPGWQAA